MDLHLTADEDALRSEARAFFAEALPGDIRRKVMLGSRVPAEDLRRWHRILDDRGWAVPGWPKEWGGTGWSAIQRYIFQEEMQLARAPMPHGQTANLAAPVVFTFGTDEQKAFFLPRMRRLDFLFCQGFSEPNAGSDLVSLRLSAVRDGDQYVLNGQKIWTSDAHEADWMFALVRTDASGRKQQGITFLLIDMATPGLTVRPILTIDRRHHTNEVFFDDVRVPLAMRIGEENKGWDYAKFLLGYERAGTARAGLPKARLALAKRLAKEIETESGILADDPAFRERVAIMEAELKALEITNLRVVTAARRSNQPDPKTSILKLCGADLQQRTAELLFDMVGTPGLGLSPDEAAGRDPVDAAAQLYFMDRAASIYGGSLEIQRDIIAKRILGL